jgi:hypothetical protein
MAIVAALWVAVLVVLVALGVAAKRGDEQLAAQFEALRPDEPNAAARPASPSQVLAETCRVLGAGRGALLAAGDAADAPRVLACHPRRVPDDPAFDGHVVAGALLGDAIIVAHTPVGDRPGRWAIRALAVPVGQAGARPGVLYLDGFRGERTLGASDRRFLDEAAASAAPLMEPRFTHDPAAPARPRRPAASAPRGSADAKRSNPPTAQ